VLLHLEILPVNGSNDLIITGEDESGNLIAKVYLCDNRGNWTELPTAIEGVLAGTIAIADVNGDGTQDVLVTGADKSNNGHTQLYLNDGKGTFSKVEDTPFPDVIGGKVVFGDVDQDTDQDLLFHGRLTNRYGYITKLYRNDGKGTFSEVEDFSLPYSSISSMALMDVDADHDLDLLVTESGGDGIKLYLNNTIIGTNEMFTEVLQPEPINSWGNRWYPPTDVDGDQDLDLFWTDGNIMQVHLNDGSGRFSEGPRFEVGVYGISRVNIVDLDEDGDLDVEVWCTFNNGYNFINDGSGSYSRSLFEKKPSPSAST
jgi:hypothetical protein